MKSAAVNRLWRRAAQLLGISGAEPGLENVRPVDDGGGRGTGIQHSPSTVSLAATLTCLAPLSVTDLAAADVTTWRQMRERLRQRHHAQVLCALPPQPGCLRTARLSAGFGAIKKSARFQLGGARPPNQPQDFSATQVVQSLLKLLTLKRSTRASMNTLTFVGI
jgi:hypothetical protein